MTISATSTPVQTGRAACLTVAEAAARTGYGVSTLRRHIKSGELPAFKIRSRVFIKAEDLEVFAQPVSLNSSEETLQEWAKRIAASAPPFKAEQRAVILSAFASTLSAE